MGDRRSWSWHGVLFQFEPVDLSDEVDAETVVWLLSLQNKTARQVNRSGGHKRVVGPQLQAPVAGAAGESHAFVNQPTSELMASGGGVDKQDPQLGDRVIRGDAEHAPDAGPVQFRDPSR